MTEPNADTHHEDQLTLRSRPRAGGKTHEVISWLVDDLENRAMVVSDQAMAEHTITRVITEIERRCIKRTYTREQLRQAVITTNVIRGGRGRRGRDLYVENVDELLARMFHPHHVVGATLSRAVNLV